MTKPIRIAAMVISAVVAVGCGLLPEERAGLACQRPLPGAEPIEVAPAPPLLRGLSPQEADEAIQTANVDADVTWRYQYSTDIGGGPSGYSECWCIPPPDGEVSQAEYVPELGQLVVFVERSQPMPGGRPQPELGWGCEAEG